MSVPSSEKIVSPYKVVCNTCTDSDVRLSTIDIHEDGVSKKKPMVIRNKTVYCKICVIMVNQSCIIIKMKQNILRICKY